MPSVPAGVLTNSNVKADIDPFSLHNKRLASVMTDADGKWIDYTVYSDKDDAKCFLQTVLGQEAGLKPPAATKRAEASAPSDQSLMTIRYFTIVSSTTPVKLLRFSKNAEWTTPRVHFFVYTL